ncbi:MAG: LacI family DNA-binding transcriptional regulator [Caldicoprobacterales bacterium]|nr:LacI family transcriptional regulator [Clostridiales bacterium]
MRETKTTIKDIAKAAGVSTTTVSLVLNNKPSRISDKTKEKILKIAKEKKYVPNKLAVNLAKQSSSTFGMIIPDISNVFFAELCKGCEVESRKAGYSITFSSSDEYISTDLEYVDTMIANRVDGIIYVSSSSTDASTNQTICQKIHSSQIPFVVVDRPIDFPYAKSVLMDNEVGGYIATKHLLELGHQRIGCLTGPMQSDTSIKRLSGYKKALKEFNISFDNSLIREGDFQIQSGYDCLSYMRGLGVTAIFCFNDMMALGIYKAARDYGLKIPEDISVVGYDDIFICDLLDVPLTTVHQPAYSIGRYAVQTLLSLVRKDKNVENIVLSPSLKVRASTRRF